MRFLVVPEGGSRPSLVVDVVKSSADLAVREASRASLFGLGCPNGILFDEADCVIFRDTFASMAASSIEVDAELKSDVVLTRADDGTLEKRVEHWLSLLSERWTDALLTSDDAAHFIADIVPAASGSLVHSIGSTR